MAKKKNHYIDNKEFLEKFVKWRSSPEFQESGRPRPPDDILIDAWKIINKYTYQSKFYNVPEDVLQEAPPLAMEFCIKYLHNFDPEKSKYPFAYVTQLAHNAILQLFKKDKVEKTNRMRYMGDCLASSTYIRSDGEIDQIATGEFAQEKVRYFDQIQKDYSKDEEVFNG